MNNEMALKSKSYILDPYCVKLSLKIFFLRFFIEFFIHQLSRSMVWCAFLFLFWCGLSYLGLLVMIKYIY